MRPVGQTVTFSAASMNLRHRRGVLAAVLVALGGCARLESQHAGTPISQVKIGFPAAGNGDEFGRGLFKAGDWAPVYVGMTAGPNGTTADSAVLVTTASDNDNIRNSYLEPLPALAADERLSALTYVRPGGMRDDITVGMRLAGKMVSQFATQTPESLNLGDTLFLAVGPRLPALVEALDHTNRSGAAPAGQYRLAWLDDIALLPTRWYGYNSVDVLLLSIGQPDIIAGLLKDLDRKQALAEWVRRGGRLVVTGSDPALLQALIVGLPLPIPIESSSQATLPRLTGVESWLRERQPPPLGDDPGEEGSVRTGNKVAGLILSRPGEVETVVAEKSERQARPLIVRAACGLGQVTVIAFDVGQPPFHGWAAEAEFWYRLLNVPRPLPEDPRAASGQAWRETSEDSTVPELASALQNHLESFPELPVVPFGWVALFMFGYLLVVGPIDYLLLRNTGRKLELTWLTLPVVVVGVSVGAYWAARQSKGDEWRINRLDLVDLDLRSGHACGNAWFSLFSPSIQNYQVRVEPAPPYSLPRSEAAVLSWLGRPDASFGGIGRARPQGFARGGYEYGPSASTLNGVPIPAWAAKSFLARWEGPFVAGSPPVSAELWRSAEGLLLGSITSRLPAVLDDVFLIAGGDVGRHTATPIRPLLPGMTNRFSMRLGDQGIRATEWVDAHEEKAPGAEATPDLLVRQALFHGESSRKDRVGNLSLRYLDQSWRLVLRDQVMLVGRLHRADGHSDGDKGQGSAPCRLSLESSAGPVPMQQVTQETFVRIFIPLGSRAPATAEGSPIPGRAPQ